MDVLETPRMLLRPWDDAYVDDFVALAADPLVMRHIGPGVVWDPEYARERHKAALQHWDDYGYGWRIAIDRSDGAMIGMEALNRLGPIVPGLDESHVEVGWWFTPRVWGRGLGAEGALAIRDEAFQRIGAECIVGRYHPDNEASGRVMDRLGMSHHSDYEDQWGLPVRVKTLDRAGWDLIRSEESADA